MGFYIEQVDCDLTQWTAGDPLAVPAGGQIDEHDDSPEETWERGGFSAVRRFNVEWAERLNIAKEFLGGGELTGTEYLLHRPHRYPKYEQAICMGVSMRPVPGTAATATGDDLNKLQCSYVAAELTVEYGTPSYDAGTTGDTTGYDPANPVLITQSFDGHAEYGTEPTANLYWDASGDADKKVITADAPGHLFPLLTWNITVHHALTFPREIFESWPGRVNQDTHYAPGIIASDGVALQFAPHTLLCDQTTLRREYSAYGYGAYEAEMAFMYREYPNWNQAIDPDGAITNFYLENGSIRYTYPETSFASFLPVV